MLLQRKVRKCKVYLKTVLMWFHLHQKRWKYRFMQELWTHFPSNPNAQWWWNILFGLEIHISSLCWASPGPLCIFNHQSLLARRRWCAVMCLHLVADSSSSSQDQLILLVLLYWIHAGGGNKKFPVWMKPDIILSCGFCPFKGNRTAGRRTTFSS